MASRSLTLSICQSCLRSALKTRPRTGFAQLRLLSHSAPEEQRRVVRGGQSKLNLQSLRASFSTSAPARNAANSTPPPPAGASGASKPIVLEQPDKFRPPSHPQRLGRRRPQPAAYNQGTTHSEREQQRTRSYPHMFPNKGTFMHWFLTNRAIHMYITIGTLVILASISLTVTFMKTSPFAHLIPPISSLVFHPITYIREGLSVLRLHVEYTSQQTEASRQKKILDAQKRRLYRRAHGMEDLNAEEEEGIDVRGLVPWDDGLTNNERASGGRDASLIRTDPWALKPVNGPLGADGKPVEAAAAAAVVGDTAVGGDAPAEVEDVTPQQPQQQRKRKLYFGIW
ncbi:hypothetical protein LTR84_004868 [Exophiala bonariae]|uniref:Uncharacterized protein n=1 Tax=Exophiala bonariae TaxID=1690606 RepID=A0AAV9NN43_9EURO|nr:hypothetical protein LTR84_004868 [Exophiala bonariae]